MWDCILSLFLVCLDDVVFAVHEDEVLLLLQLLVGANGIQNPQRKLLLSVLVECFHSGVHVLLVKGKIGIVVAASIEAFRPQRTRILLILLVFHFGLHLCATTNNFNDLFINYIHSRKYNTPYCPKIYHPQIPYFAFNPIRRSLD